MHKTIRAVVHEAAISKVSRFFDATTEQIISELLQNARRANASRVDITTRYDRTVTISDNGHGIADPATLLSFGQSDWSVETARAEDPAGMGIFSLARRRTRIASRPRSRGGEEAAGWHGRARSGALHGQARDDRRG